MKIKPINYIENPTYDTKNDPENVIGDDIEQWWTRKAMGEISDMVAKTREYGGSGKALDLIGIGRDLAAVAGREVDDQEATEIGIWFYIRGKVGRAMAAVADGRLPSDDTIHDLLVYGRMLQRVRETGVWEL